MTPIDYIRIDAEILRLEMSDKAKLLLGLVKSFNKKGLMMSNPEIAKLLNCSVGSIKRAIKEAEEYLRIENAQSKYRKIFYSRINEPVEKKATGADMSQYNDSTGASHTPTGAYTTPTGADMSHITKGIQQTTYTTFSFHLREDGKLWYLPEDKLNQYLKTYSTLDVKGELAKAAQWLIDNPNRRKTARGMSRFLNGWLSRAEPSPPQEYATRDLSEEEAEELMKEVLRDN